MRMPFRSAVPAFSIALTVLFAYVIAGASAQAAATTVSGIITAITPTSITLQKPDGASAVADLSTTTIYLRALPGSLESIKPGDALGVGARIGPGDTLVATEVTIFPPALWERVRKGQFTMRSGGIMTNAQVNRIVDSVEGRVLHMRITGGTDQITVPTGVPIRRVETLGMSALSVGERILVRGSANPDGTVQADSVSVVQSA